MKGKDRSDALLRATNELNGLICEISIDVERNTQQFSVMLSQTAAKYVIATVLCLCSETRKGEAGRLTAYT